jgi:hypothetical protein
MTHFRYDTSGQWFKGNAHIHSTASDGGKTFTELAALYASAGYDFLFRTDHWQASDVAADETDAPLLWIDGIEFDGVGPEGEYGHVLCLGKVEGAGREDGLAAAVASARDQGALCFLAHPQWSGNTLETSRRWQLDGVEVYNHVCHWLNGKSDGLVHWNAALERDPGLLALAVDDAHLRPDDPGWNGGWIVVNAEACTTPALMAAIRSGNFFASCGPEFHSITWDGREVHLRTSPVQFVRLVGPRSKGARVGSFNGVRLEEVSFAVPKDWDYVYVEVEDEHGRRAWTNALFVEG